MGKRKDLRESDKGKIVMARRLGQSISKTAALGVLGVPGLQGSVSIKSNPRKEQWLTDERVMGDQHNIRQLVIMLCLIGLYHIYTKIGSKTLV